MAATKDSNIVKVVVISSDDISSEAAPNSTLGAQFIELDQKQPLTSIIQELCPAWSITNFDHYALKFYDNTAAVGKVRRDVIDKLSYVNEKNRNDVKNGSLLCMTYSAAKTAQTIYDFISKNSADQQKEALSRLSNNLAADPTFAQEFISKQGLQLLIGSIEGNVFSEETLSYCLLAFTMLMDHGYVCWDVLEPKFIGKIACYVNTHASTTKNQSFVDSRQSALPDARPITSVERILTSSLGILESIVTNSSSNHLVEQEVPLTSLLKLLPLTSTNIPQYTIALMNALFLKADPAKRKAMAATLTSNQFRSSMLSNISCHKSEMAHQLYVFQTLMLNMLEERMNTKLDQQDQEAISKIVELRKIAFGMEEVGNPREGSIRKPGGYVRNYKKLGFKNNTNPAEDFQETPPGILALECMYYFAKYHQENYTKVVLENSCRSDEHECPFARTAIQLTRTICEILKIGEQHTEQGDKYYPIFFTQDHFFEEFFCVAIMLLNKTWKEMRATTEDFPKVFSVVREQISRALENDAHSMEAFKAKLNTLTYNEITNLWQQERNCREESFCQAKPIIDLREHVTPEILDLIQQQRLNYLVEGSIFSKYNTKVTRVKDKFWYCRLAPNHKVFHYGDCAEHTSPSIEQLQNKIPVVDIKSLVVGKDCPHMKDLKLKKTTVPLAFSIVLDAEQGSLDFVAANEQIRDHWTDGINALLGNPMTSETAKSDLETLLSMDIKLRLLDTEGVKIPTEPPPIPEDPPNYDFYYDYK